MNECLRGGHGGGVGFVSNKSIPFCRGLAIHVIGEPDPQMRVASNFLSGAGSSGVLACAHAYIVLPRGTVIST